MPFSGQKARIVLKLWLSSRRTENKYVTAGKSSASEISVYSTPECVSIAGVFINYGMPITSVCTIAWGTLKIDCPRKGKISQPRGNLVSSPKTWNCSVPQNRATTLCQNQQQAYHSEYQNAIVKSWPQHNTTKIPGKTSQKSVDLMSSLQMIKKAETTKQLLTWISTREIPTWLPWTIAIHPHVTSTGADQEKISRK